MESQLNNMDLTVSFFQSKRRNPSDIVRRNVFLNISKPEKGPELLDSIFNTDIGKRSSKDIDEEFSSDEFIPSKYVELKPFNDFKKKRKTVYYSRVFQQKQISNKGKDYFEKYKKFKGEKIYHYTDEVKCDNQVHPAQIREGFRTILHKLIPQEFTGNSRNRKKILKTLYNLMLTAKSEPFSLISLMKQINVSSMTWIKADVNKITKYILVAKFIKWLFQYFIAVIYYQFYVTYIKEERVFIFVKNWNKQKKDYIKKKNDQMALEPLKMASVNKIRNKVYFIPKREGVRSIVTHKYIGDEKLNLRKALSVLKFLYETHLKRTNNNFSEQYIKLFEKNDSENKDVYIISSDIRDAYGSIIPAKLFDIVIEMFEKLPHMLRLKWQKCRDSRKYKYLNTNLQQKSVRNIEVIEKSTILHIVEEFIHNTKVIIDNNIYSLCKGIAQGLMLSAILCDIYYTHMWKKYFSRFEKSAYLFTYVDDSIYITKNLDQANQYLNRINKGLADYNCWFNSSKLRTNVESNSDIEYLGWKIDTKTLEVEPTFKSARYSTSFSRLSALTLEFKMINLTALKLNKLILCKKINSERRIFNNVKLIAQHQAKRCYALMSSLQENSPKFSVKTVCKINLKIIRKIENLTEWDKQEKYDNRTKLLDIMWTSYYHVFKKNKNFLYLIKDIKKKKIKPYK